MVVYSDTSFLFSLYAQDANTHRAAGLAKKLHGMLVVTPLQGFELRNALRLSVFRGDIADEECARLLELIEADIKSGAFAETPIPWAEVFAAAEDLSAAHTGKLGIRAFDVLHVAAAIVLGAREFFTFDNRQKTLAVKAGLKVKP